MAVVGVPVGTTFETKFFHYTTPCFEFYMKTLKGPLEVHFINNSNQRFFSSSTTVLPEEIFIQSKTNVFVYKVCLS